MRRGALIVTAVVVMLSMTMSLAIAGMRISSVTFSTTDSSGSLSLMTASSDTTSEGTTCSDDTPCVGLSLNATGTLTGISDKIADGAIINLIVQGVPTSVTCSNEGGEEAPGQNPAPVTATGEQLLTSADITKRGTAPMNLTATFPTLTYPGGEMGCPNNNWTATLNAVQFTCATILATLDAKIILEEHYKLDESCTA